MNQSLCQMPIPYSVLVVVLKIHSFLWMFVNVMDFSEYLWVIVMDEEARTRFKSIRSSSFPFADTETSLIHLATNFNLCWGWYQPFTETKRQKCEIVQCNCEISLSFPSFWGLTALDIWYLFSKYMTIFLFWVVVPAAPKLNVKCDKPVIKKILMSTTEAL